MGDQTEIWVSSGHLSGRQRGGRMGGPPHRRKHRAAPIRATWSRQRPWSRGAWASLLSASLALAGLSTERARRRGRREPSPTISLRSGWGQGRARALAVGGRLLELRQAILCEKWMEQVYAQPLVVGSTVIAATENNRGLRAGQRHWRWQNGLRKLGSEVAGVDGGLRVTSTPNIGSHVHSRLRPKRRRASTCLRRRMTAQMPQLPHWYMHALDVVTGAEKTRVPRCH